MFKDSNDYNHEIVRNIANLTLVKVFHDMGLPVHKLSEFHIEPLEQYCPGFSYDTDAILILRAILNNIFSDKGLFEASTFIDAESYYSGINEERMDYVKMCIEQEFENVDFSKINLVETDFLLLEDDFTEIDIDHIKRQIIDTQFCMFTKKREIPQGNIIESDEGMQFNFELSTDKKKLVLYYEYGYFSYSATIIALFLHFLVKQLKTKG